ncbi:MAG TPA: hypothetical protein VH500_25180 [Nitrososphaeraceae archaeon]|jgi:hypothetical protein
MKTNNMSVGVYDSTAHSKSKLIHENDFAKARTTRANTFPVVAAAGYAAVTFEPNKSKLIHEHDFITIGINKENSSLLYCINCGQYYCDLCGKALC